MVSDITIIRIFSFYEIIFYTNNRNCFEIRSLKMKPYYSFVYIDDYFIDSLYSQVFGDITEQTVLTTNSEDSNLSAESKIPSFFNFGLSGKETFSESYTNKFVISTPRKAQMLINYLTKEKTFIPSLQEIIANNQPFNESLLFVGKGTFFLSDIIDKKTDSSLLYMNQESNYKKTIIDENSVLILETGNTYFIHKHCADYMNTDDYYKMNISKNVKYGIMMHMSNSKIKKDIRHLTWAISKAKSFNFFVFGELVKSSEQFYKAIPFAVWM